MVGKGKLPVESEDAQKLRFQVELEFVQCLANPNYLHSQRGYFKDAAFVNYLKYLLYWKEPEYAKYLKFPMCLYFLDLLQYEHFRREILWDGCNAFSNK
uniref:Mediator of RNA polymerase II transcription subunit 31 n=1 Tax=Anopheles culicifacies TaxID=139723 RepID=A0A182MA23_9DIPT